jgi:hypothetical protein
MARNQFENTLVKSLNAYFALDGWDKAIAYRQRQSMYVEQFCDIMVDSRTERSGKSWYLAIECKSIGSEVKTLLWTQHFHYTAGAPSQIERMQSFADKSGRTPILALEVRGIGKNRGNVCFFIPWEVVVTAARLNQPGLNVQEVVTGRYPRMTKHGGIYVGF